jgi:4-carboxymuconolactone decarboxylase
VARLPLIDPGAEGSEQTEFLRQVAGERGRPFNVYRVLANSPALFERFYAVSAYLWNDSALEPPLIELVILRVAQLTASDYEWSRHVGLARRVGVAEAKIVGLERWREAAPPFEPGEQAALALAEEMIRRIEAGEETVARVREVFGEQATLELVVLVGFYGMVSGLLRSLAVDPEPEDTPVFAPAQRGAGSNPG